MDKELELKIARAKIEATKDQTKQIVDAISSITLEPTIVKEDSKLTDILTELVKQNNEPICVKLILKYNERN